MRLFFSAVALLFLSFIMASPAIAAPTEPASVGLQSAASSEGIGIRLLDIPAATQDDPRARSYIVDNLPPGTAIERRVEIQNNTDETQTIHVYAGAASISNGTFTGADGAAVNELTTWTSVDRPEISLRPGDVTTVLVTIAIPADAPEGEQYADVWAEIRTPAANRIVTASRAGIRIYLSVAPGNGPAADFSIDKLAPNRNDSGEPEVVTTVTNTGGRALDISGNLSLADGPGGLSVDAVPVEQPVTVAPGETAEVVVTLAKALPNGPWQATLELRSGLVVHEATGRISFPDSGTGEVVEPDRGPSPLLVGGGVILLFAVAASVTWLIRRRSTATK